MLARMKVTVCNRSSLRSNPSLQPVDARAFRRLPRPQASILSPPSEPSVGEDSSRSQSLLPNPHAATA